MEANRQYWSDQQQHFRRLLHSHRYTEAIDVFLEQHAMLHTASLVPGYRWSFQDEVSADLTDEQWRQTPSGRMHSIAWLLWHIARTEDVTINLLLANTDQLFHAEHWCEHLAVPTGDIGTEMSARDIITLGAQIDIIALRAYRRAVGQRTRELVQQMTARELRQRVEPERMELLTPAPWQAGSQFREVRDLGGRKTEVFSEITAFETDALFVIRSKTGPEWLGSWKFEPEGTGTRLRWTGQMRMKGFARLLEPIVGAQMRSQIGQQFAALPRLIEREIT